ncbi:MAG: ferritin-like domain-containing protein [Chromatiaceae bacterium]|jgi:bacterioferritin
MTFGMVADQRVLGYLGRALSLELSAVQLYTAQARLAESWSLSEAAERLRAEAHEEMTHAERIIARMLALGVAPGASQLRPVGLGTNLSDMLRHDQAFEMELVGLYEDAVRHCSRAGLSEDRLLFQALLEEEQAHARELAAWIGQLESGVNQRRDPGAAF